MTSSAVLYADGDPTGEYARLRLPSNWQLHICQEPAGLGSAMNWFYDTYRHAPSFGWLADDLRPRTKGFDKKLEEAAGDWHFACSADDWYSLDFYLTGLVRKGHDMCGALCWGGELVRAAGCWAFLQHVGIDAAWCLFNSRLGNARYCADVMVEHLQYRNGKRPKDLTDEITVPETDLYKHGIAELRPIALQLKNESGPWFDLLEKIRSKMIGAMAKPLPIDEPWWLETT